MSDRYGGIPVMCITGRKKHKGFFYLRKTEFVFGYGLHSIIIPFDVKTFILQKEIIKAPGFLSVKRKKAFSVKTSNGEIAMIVPLEKRGFEDISQLILKMKAEIIQNETDQRKAHEKDEEILLEIRNAARDMRNTIRLQLSREIISPQSSPIQDQPQKKEMQQINGIFSPVAEETTISHSNSHNSVRYQDEDSSGNNKISEIMRIIDILDQRRNELSIQTTLLINEGFSQRDAEKVALIILDSKRQHNQKFYIYNRLRHIYGHTMGSDLYRKIRNAYQL